MAKKSDAALMSQADYARHRGKTRQYIGRLAKAGVIIMRNGKVDVDASDAVLDDQPVEVEPGDRNQVSSQPRAAAGGVEATAQQPTNLAQAKLAEMVYRAKLRRLDYETRSGKLVPTDEVKAKWFSIARQIRDKLLAIPAKLSPQVAALTDAREVRELLDGEITAILRALQDDIRYRRT